MNTKRQQQLELKKQKAYSLLAQMTKPASIIELARLNNDCPSRYSVYFQILKDEGLIREAGMRVRERLWVAVETQTKPASVSLAQPVYTHSADAHADKYKAQARLARHEYKSARAWAGTWQYDA